MQSKSVGREILQSYSQFDTEFCELHGRVV